jgi:hypothetical protein
MRTAGRGPVVSLGALAGVVGSVMTARLERPTAVLAATTFLTNVVTSRRLRAP